MKESLSKGPAAEEILRNYFINIGYYAVRGCKFRYTGSDVTDVDLWLYGKKSAITRERLNVDIKNKKTPQALERIFWTKGLQSVLGLDGCIVSTTDNRESVRRFGLQHSVMVFDGTFLSRLMKSGRSHQDRVSEEELLSDIEDASLGKLGGDWRGRYELGKSRLLDALSFDGCNAWLNDISYFMEQAVQNSSGSAPSWRLLYLSTAKFLIAVDFILSQHVAADQEERRQILEDGFRYGSSGKGYTEKVGTLAASLVVSVMAEPALGDSVKLALHEQAMSVRAELLAEHLSKGTVPSNLFDLARELDAAGFSRSIPKVMSLSSGAQSIFGMLADFYGIDRKRVLL